MSDDLLKKAEKDVLEAALSWHAEQEQSGSTPSSNTSQKLRIACYMLRRAKTVTGKLKLEDIMRAQAEQEAKEKDPQDGSG